MRGGCSRRCAAGCEVGVSASSAASRCSRSSSTATRASRATRCSRGSSRVLRRRVTVYDPNDWRSPYASGSAKVDAYVVCPCSSGTLGAIASGLSQNLIHRAASVALKEERKLVLCPRETPLSAIHLENMLTLRRAGATILFLAPGFYHGATSVEELVDFVVARMLDQLGLENALAQRWGDRDARARRRADDVRPDRAGLRRDEPGDDGGPRHPLAPARGGRASCGPGDRVLDAACGTGDLALWPTCAPAPAAVTGLDFSEQMLARARAQGARARVGAGRHARAAVCGRVVRRGDRRLRDPERRRPRARAARAAAGAAPGRPARDPRDHAGRAGPLRPFFSLWFDRIVPLLGRVLPGGEAYTYLPASVRRFPAAEELAELMRAPASSEVRFRLLGGLDRRPAHGRSRRR